MMVDVVEQADFRYPLEWDLRVPTGEGMSRMLKSEENAAQDIAHQEK